MATIGKRRRVTESLTGPHRLDRPVTTATTADGSSRRPASPEEKTTSGEQRYTMVCVQQDDGTYVAEIAEAPEIRFVGKTRAQAERVVSKIYTDTRGPQEPHNAEEDRRWIELARGNRERKASPQTNTDANIAIPRKCKRPFERIAFLHDLSVPYSLAHIANVAYIAYTEMESEDRCLTQRQKPSGHRTPRQLSSPIPRKLSDSTTSSNAPTRTWCPLTGKFARCPALSIRSWRS